MLQWIYNCYSRKINRYKLTFYFDQNKNKKVLILTRDAKIKIKEDYSICDNIL